MWIPSAKARSALASAFCFLAVSAPLLHPYAAFQDIWWELIKGLAKLDVPKSLLKGGFMLGKGIGLLIPFIAAMLVYYWLACRPKPDGHTRCGSCQYILKGLTKPRCPECGNPI